MKDGFIKVAAAAPELRVADPKFNAEKIVECVEKAREEGVKLLAFPELAITGATCGHLYYQRYLLDAALEEFDDEYAAGRYIRTLIDFPSVANTYIPFNTAERPQIAWWW